MNAYYDVGVASGSFEAVNGNTTGWRTRFGDGTTAMGVLGRESVGFGGLEVVGQVFGGLISVVVWFSVGEGLGGVILGRNPGSLRILKGVELDLAVSARLILGDLLLCPICYEAHSRSRPSNICCFPLQQFPSVVYFSNCHLLFPGSITRG